MTTFLLLRHAHSVANNAGILAGQLEGIGLSKDGVAQVNKLTSAFENLKIDRIVSSPMQRCLETVELVAKSKKKRISVDERLIEMNYGSWSGKKLSKLSRMKDWKVIQAKPSTFRFPQGRALRSLKKGLNHYSKICLGNTPKKQSCL